MSRLVPWDAVSAARFWEHSLPAAMHRRWVDSVLMQRELGEAAATLP